MAPVKFSFNAIGSSAVVFSLFERLPDVWRRVRRPLRCPTACASLWQVLHAAHKKPTPSPFITIGSPKGGHFAAWELRTGIDIYELSPTRIQHNERLMLPGASLGRLHAKTAVINQAMVYIGSVNLDPRSESTNTELGLFARCPELAKEVIRVINISKLQSSYRLRFAPDGQTLEWLAIDD